MSFTKKLIRVTLTMASGSFGSGGNVKVLDGYRVSSEIVTTGGVSGSSASIAIYGMTLSDMNQLTNVGTAFLSTYNNTVLLEAGDENGLSTAFAGKIMDAYFDGNSQPQVCFRIAASTMDYYSQMKADPISTKATTDVAGLMSGLAKTMGLGFENAGVVTKLSASYYYGSPWSMVQQIAKDSGILYLIDRGKLVIAQPGTARAGGEVIISPETGLVGYPTFNQRNVNVTALYNPNVQYQGEVTIKSSLPSATGKFHVNALQYSLESQVPGGRWFMHLECIPTTGQAS